MFGLGTINSLNSRVSKINREKKHGSNLTAITTDTAQMVLSYGWYPIIIRVNGRVYVNSTKYSPTTSRQTTRNLRCEEYSKIEYKTHEEMVALSHQLKF